MIDELECRSEEDSATVIDASSSCCIPVPCGWHVGREQRTFRERQQDWEEEARGWTGL